MIRLYRVTAALSLLLLGGCGAAGSWFGEDDDPPLEGTRIPVMTLERQLEADPQAAAVPARLPSPVTNLAWPQPGGTPNHAPGHLAHEGPLATQWSRDIGTSADDERRILGEPLVGGDLVFAVDVGDQVTAVERATGREVWSRELEPEEGGAFFGGGIALDAGRLFVTTGFAEILAFDALSGEELWRRRATAPLRAAPTAAGGLVLAVTLDNQLLAFSADSGELRWSHAGLLESAGLLGGASPAVAGGVVLVAYTSGELVALRADNGAVLWDDSLAALRRADPIADLAQIRGHPVVADGQVIAVGHSGITVGIDFRRGLRVWEAEAGGTQMPWVAGDLAFLVTGRAESVALNRRDGRARWVTQLERFSDPEERLGPIQWFGPMLAGGRLLHFSSVETWVALDPFTGEVLEEGALPAAPATAPILAEGVVYMVGENATLYALR